MTSLAREGGKDERLGISTSHNRKYLGFGPIITIKIRCIDNHSTIIIALIIIHLYDYNNLKQL